MRQGPDDIESIESAKVLIADDESTVVDLLVRTLKHAGFEKLYPTTDARRVVTMFRELKPDLVLIDNNMPFLSGIELIRKLSLLEGEDMIPIMMITGQSDLDTRAAALAAGAVDFLTKPFDRIEVIVRVRNLLRIRFARLALLEDRSRLAQKVEDRTASLRESQLEIVQRLGRAAEYKDEQTGLHIVRMGWYSAQLLEATGAGTDDVQLMLHAAPLHDVGKIGIPDNILKKPGKLDADEWTIMKSHTTIGAELLSKSKSEVLRRAEVIAISHHEKWDGGGYPNGTAGEDIPIGGRICALCDVFDALTSERPYKHAWPVDEALNEMQKLSGSHFEPALVDVFFEILPTIMDTHNLFKGEGGE